MELQVTRPTVSGRSNLFSYFFIASVVIFIINTVWTEKPSYQEIDLNHKLDSVIKYMSRPPPAPAPPAPEPDQSIYSDQDIGNIIKKNKELELKIKKLEKLYLEQN